ncbi:MAG TPA: kelch repeat-containing protein, partial [Verrucomicrobiota bacterium]|nr:kelch repeat-containing protein [Verrucomicrobiota bacterium]
MKTQIGQPLAWLEKTGTRLAGTFLMSALLALSVTSIAQVPGIISHQGKLMVQGVNFTGTAFFKFALVNAGGTTTLWSHNGTSTNGGEPADPAISLSVNQGIFSVNLGDTSIPNMTHQITPDVFTNESVWLRVWVNDGTNGFQRLLPDRRVASAGYALVAANVLMPGMVLVSSHPQDPAYLSNGFQMVTMVPAPAWCHGSSVNAPSARLGHSAIWDGQQMIVWGGSVSDATPVATGGMYRSESDTWTATSTLDAPSPRSEHTAVWADSEMIVWGGVGDSGPLNTGARFTPATQTWIPVTTTGAPPERRGHNAVWTGNYMLVWGGRNNAGFLNDGALYDPHSNHWTPLSIANPPEARFGAAAAWANDRFIVWGGTGELGELGSGSQLVFSGSTPSHWSPMSMTDAPSPRSGHTAVWTGSVLLVWGGQCNGTVLGDGAIYS